jgi:hypothetical protein
MLARTSRLRWQHDEVNIMDARAPCEVLSHPALSPLILSRLVIRVSTICVSPFTYSPLSRTSRPIFKQIRHRRMNNRELVRLVERQVDT